jgi:2-methylisocitrate lyase-like PEP mutase family enzyme
MTRSVDEKRTAFRALHAEGCFVIPNPWDVGSARLLEQLGFAALASSSAGFAWTTGQPDYAVTRAGVLAHLAQLCAAVDLPVNADFESGFAREPDAVAANVRLAVATGVAGLSIEDRDVDHPGYVLHDDALAVERIRAAHAATGPDVLLVARTELLLREPGAIGAAIDKLVRFADAGADVLFAPGVRKPDDIAAMVRAVAPRPVNVVMGKPGVTLAQLADLGVRRVSVGGALARAAWAGMLAAARALREGSFDGLAGAMPSAELNQLFGRYRPDGS